MAYTTRSVKFPYHFERNVQKCLISRSDRSIDHISKSNIFDRFDGSIHQLILNSIIFNQVGSKPYGKTTSDCSVFKIFEHKRRFSKLKSYKSISFKRHQLRWTPRNLQKVNLIKHGYQIAVFFVSDANTFIKSGWFCRIRFDTALAV